MNNKIGRFLAIAAGVAVATGIGSKLLHKEPDYRALWVERMGGTNALALTQIITGEEPYVLTFSIPLNLEIRTWENGFKSTNNCWVDLSLDGMRSEPFCCRTNNGYRIHFQTPFSYPGQKHVLKMVFSTGGSRIYGPPLTIVYTNLFQFDMNLFRDRGVPLRCNLGVQRVAYKINIYDTNRSLLNVIEGQTTNGLIDEVWDFKASNGTIRTDEEFYADYYIRHLTGGTNGNAEDDLFIPTNPCPMNYLRDKSGH
jgi:hypothetical protein